MSTVQSAYKSDPGRRRNNEDFVDFYEPVDPVERQVRGCLYIVADGVGGAARGERASQYAAKKLLYEYYQNPDSIPGELKDILVRINRDIHEYAEESERVTRMATTLVAALIINGKLIIANVGDSRAYLIRDGTATQLSRDHNIVGEMVRNGELTEEQAQKSKLKNKLSRSLGGEAEVHVDVYPPIPLKPGDKILLCSDGLTRYALQGDIARMTAEGSLQEVIDRMVDFANRRGGEDNVSVMMVAYEPVEVLEPTVRIPAVPGLVSLDTMDTLPYVKPSKRRNTRLLEQSVRVTFVVVALFVMVLFVFIFHENIVGLILPKLPTTLVPIPAVTQATIPIPTAVITSDTDATRIVIEETPILINTESPATITSIAPTSPIPSQTSNPTLIPTTSKPPFAPHICIAQVTNENNNLTRVLRFFNYDYIISEDYFRCTFDPEKNRCNVINEIPAHNEVFLWEWIVSPVEKEMCDSEKGGKWVEGTSPK